MSNKELQEKRMKSYFLQATREILKGEGIKALSVRNIAERAGYSYATLYNYFKDINELVSQSLLDFKAESQQHIAQKTDTLSPGKARIKVAILTYFEYFIQYPGVFDLFYLERLSSTKANKSILGFIDEITEKDWQYLLDEQAYSPKEINGLKADLNYLCIGLLVGYLKRYDPPSYQEFIKRANESLDRLLK